MYQNKFLSEEKVFPSFSIIRSFAGNSHSIFNMILDTMNFITSFYNCRFESETRFYDYVQLLLHVFPQMLNALVLCECCLASLAIMVSSLSILMYFRYF